MTEWSVSFAARDQGYRFTSIELGAGGESVRECLGIEPVQARTGSMYRVRAPQLKAGRDVQGFTVIEDGLKPGERVATRGVLLLNELVGAGNKP